MSSINTNISAYYAQNNLRAAGASAQSSIARLSSGNKIIKASDDVAALSIGTILRTDVNSLKTALVNASQGATLLQVADGALARVGEILQRQKALAVQANSGTLSATERGYLGQEFDKLKEELDRIVDKTNFNGVGLINGNLASTSGIESDGPVATGNYQVTTTGTSFTYLTTGGVNSTGFTAAGFSTGANTSAQFQGSMAGVTVTGTQVTDASDADNVALSITFNGVEYAGQSVLDQSAGGAVQFEARDGSGQTFTLTFAAAAGTAITNQTTAEAYADAVQAELRTMTIYQDRAIDTSDKTKGITAAELANTILDGMDGSDFILRGKNFTDASTVSGSTVTPVAQMPSISNFKVVSEGATLASFYVTINGETYKNEDLTVSSDITGIALGGGTGILRLTNVNDSNSFLDIDFAGGTLAAIGVTNSDEAQALEDAINKALGSGSTGGVAFQVGTDADDKVSISLDAVDTDNLYVDDTGAAVDMDLVDGDLGDIQEALDNAIATVTARRADVGALQSRFNYASSALESSIQNLDAARGQFLDADISEESTAFARAQVLQQAAISVLAQANQIPQNLLKLIG